MDPPGHKPRQAARWDHAGLAPGLVRVWRGRDSWDSWGGSSGSPPLLESTTRSTRLSEPANPNRSPFFFNLLDPSRLRLRSAQSAPPAAKAADQEGPVSHPLQRRPCRQADASIQPNQPARCSPSSAGTHPTARALLRHGKGDSITRPSAAAASVRLGLLCPCVNQFLDCPSIHPSRLGPWPRPWWW